MKRISAFIMALLLALAPLAVLAEGVRDVPVWDGSTGSSYAGGNGTESNPYQIANGKQLAYLAKRVREGESYAGKYFKLTSDIRLNTSSNWQNWTNESQRPAHEWTPVSTEETRPFSGTFDGQGHWIRGLYTNSTQTTQKTMRSLFGCVEGATIKNLTVEQSCVISFGYAGAIASSAVDSAFISCKNGGKVYSDNRGWVGGIAAFARGTSFTDCENSGIVDGYLSGDVGGIIGDGRSCTVENCRNTGVIDVTNDRTAGGIAGNLNEGCTVTGCTNIGSFSLAGTGSVGGIVGDAFDAVITGCTNTADVSSKDKAGGIAAYSQGIITGCSNSGAVIGRTDVGGICGDAGTISDCINRGNVRSHFDTGAGYDQYCGGIAAHAGAVTNCVNYGDSVTEEIGYAAGIVYRAVEVSGCDNHGTVVSDRGGSAGIIIQFRYGSGTAERCRNYGTVYANGGNSGGAAGVCLDNSGASSVTKCENHGPVNGWQAGGVAVNCSGTLEDSYSTAIVVGTQAAGIALAVSGTLRRCYNIGAVTGDEADAVTVYRYNGVIEDCFFLDSCGGSEYGTALSDAEMRDAASYAGFDFVNTWTMLGGDDYPYAELRAYWPDDPAPTPTPEPTPEPTPTPVPIQAGSGDVNGDGSTDTVDALIVLRYAMSIIDTMPCPDEADVNGDGQIDAVDALNVLRIALGVR